MCVCVCVGEEEREIGREGWGTEGEELMYVRQQECTTLSVCQAEEDIGPI